MEEIVKFAGIIGFVLLCFFRHRLFSDEGSTAYTPTKRVPRYDSRDDIVLLIAAVMMEGGPKRVELQYVRRALREYLGDSRKVKLCMTLLPNFYIHNIDVERAAASYIRRHTYETRIVFLKLLNGITTADGRRTGREENMIRRIGRAMQVGDADVDKIINPPSENVRQTAYTYRPADSLYSTLGIAATSTDEEVKKAYRSLVKRYHPDRFANMDEEMQEKAEVRFMTIQEAYEKICLVRGIK